ncbi:type II toxin-antitoxin system RelE/ParE family toxin [Nocardia sp. NPDC058633]|uniref:type II toxin-antitoxin system RelE/ParE family toxin n=1 Tax=Nocardia sp. NPDC058633 TaxID=3346568 RepID=UPI00364FF18E
MEWEIVLLEPVDHWFIKLCESDPASAALIEQALDQLAAVGPALGRPLVDTLEHSRLKNLKELRPGSSGRSEIRMLFVFDPDRHAIILVSGDKTGRWSKWYDDAIPLAELRYADYRADSEKEI